MTLTAADVIALTNKAKRQEVLNRWKEWPVWLDAPSIGLTVHKLDLPGGGAFTASWYEGDKVVGRWTVDQHVCFHLIGYGGKLAHGSQGETLLLDELMELRKKLLKVKKNDANDR